MEIPLKITLRCFRTEISFYTLKSFGFVNKFNQSKIFNRYFYMNTYTVKSHTYWYISSITWYPIKSVRWCHLLNCWLTLIPHFIAYNSNIFPAVCRFNSECKPRNFPVMMFSNLLECLLRPSLPEFYRFWTDASSTNCMGLPS